MMTTLMDVQPELLLNILVMVQEDCHRELQNKASVHMVFAQIYSVPAFWIAAIKYNDWEVNWDTGLSLKDYYIMLCQMSPLHRQRLKGLTNEATTIEDAAFVDCRNLRITRLPDQLQTIGSTAFSGCTSLVLESLPVNLSAIGRSAFGGCTSLALKTYQSTCLPLNCSGFAAPSRSQSQPYQTSFKP